MPFPREFSLAAACCRWPLSTDAITAIRELADASIDWPYFIRIVQRQRVQGLVHHALSLAKIEPPDDVARKLDSSAQRIGRLNLALARESIRLQRIFDAADIPMANLKGVGLGQLVYGSLVLKPSRDIDILVGTDHALPALRILEYEGYVLQRPAKYLNEAQRRAVVRCGKEAELVNGRLRVDLHWKLADNPLLLTGIDVSSSRVAIRLPGAGDLHTLAEGDLFAFLCVHGACHRWSRLKWLADLNALISSKGDADLLRLYRYAGERGAGICAGQAMLLCQKLFATRLPSDLVRQLQESRRLAKLVVAALNAMVDADAETELGRGVFDVTRGVFGQFFLGTGATFFIAECRHLSVGVPDAILLPLPAPLWFLYPILRLPLWLWRRASWAVGALGTGQTKSKPLHQR